MPEPAAIDFAKYRKPELFEKVRGLLNVPKTLRTIVVWSAVALAVVLVGLPLLFANRVHGSVFGALYVYTCVAAVLGGALFGGGRALAAAMENLVRVLDLTLEIAEGATGDLSDISRGERAVPTPRELVMQVYEKVLVPTLETVVLGQLQWFGRPVLWLYRATLGRLLRRVLRQTAREAPDAPSESDKVPAAEVHTRVAAVAGRLASARRRCVDTAGFVGRAVVIPLYLLGVVFTVFAVAPLIIVWYLSG